MMKHFLFAAVAAVSISLFAEEKVVFDGGDPAVWKNNLGASPIVKTESGSFTFVKGANLISLPAKKIKIDPNKVYTLSAEIRTTDGQNATKTFWLGFTSYLEDGTVIERINAYRDVPTLGTLVKDANVGDTQVTLSGNLDAWVAKLTPNASAAQRGIFFNAKDDKSDIPNFNTTKRRLKGNCMVKNADGTYTVTLPEPLTKAYAANSKAALHYIGMTYQFVDCQKRKLPNPTWTTFKGSFALKANPGEAIDGFYPRTAYIGVGLFTWDYSKAYELRNVKIVESDL